MVAKVLYNNHNNPCLLSQLNPSQSSNYISALSILIPHSHISLLVAVYFSEFYLVKGRIVKGPHDLVSPACFISFL
jgi:hypothetical protein